MDTRVIRATLYLFCMYPQHFWQVSYWFDHR